MEESKLLLRKGIYPYDYMDGEGKFCEMHLPLVEEFYSHVIREAVTEDDYKHACHV